MGGAHVTFMADEALEHADFVARGEGEHSLMSFIDSWEGNRDFSSVVPGLSYKKNKRTIHNPRVAFVTNLDSLPLCDFSLSPAPLKVLPVQTSRGCPYDCSFCSVTGMFGRSFRFRSTDHVLSELRRYRNLNKMIFFYDDHFGASPTRAKQLLRAMIAEGLTFKFSTQVRIETGFDLEMLALLKQAGCHTLFIGFESVNPESLKEMKKKQTLEGIITAIENIHKYGINIHGMFVHGFDSDTRQTANETVRFAKQMNLTSAQFLILTPFPGSELRRTMADRIVSNDWSMYDTHHVVYRPLHFTMLGLQKAQIESHSSFYSLYQMVKKFFMRRFLDVGIALYARLTNRRWKKANRSYIEMITLAS